MNINHYLRQVRIVFAFCLIQQLSYAQSIPDTSFANAIRLNCPSCIDADNNLTAAASALTTLNLNQKNINDLSGIEGFINLADLFCKKNNLITLPALPQSLINLDCADNKLTAIPDLPENLVYLDCSINQLDSLPILPNNLAGLFCYFNNLHSLPDLPSTITIMDCSFNNLLSLPPLPVMMGSLFCEGNPSLRCLPVLPDELFLLSTLGTQISCIPNEPALLIMTPDLPICTELCDSGTLTDQPIVTNTFSVSPNPANSVISVEFSDEYKTNTILYITNLNGSVMKSLMVDGDTEIWVGNLPDGIYFLEACGEKGCFRKKLLKQFIIR